MPTIVLWADAIVAVVLLTGRRARIFFPVTAGVLVVVLIGHSEPRLVGDSGEYIAMALNLAQLKPPSLSLSDLAQTATYLPGDAGRHLVQPEYRGPDDRQDFPHFWFYSLLAAPFARAAVALG